MTFKQNPISSRFGNRVEKSVTKSNKSFFLPFNIRFDSRSIKASPVATKKHKASEECHQILSRKMPFRNFSIKQSTFHVPGVLGTDIASHSSKKGRWVNFTRIWKKILEAFELFVAANFHKKYFSMFCYRDVFSNWCTTRHPISFPTSLSKENIDVYLCLKFIVPWASNLLLLPSFPLSKPLKNRLGREQKRRKINKKRLEAEEFRCLVSQTQNTQKEIAPKNVIAPITIFNVIDIIE